jgi:hypothetical protein
VQLRFNSDLTGEQYVNQQAWRTASLPRCPLHPNGGCGFARHGTYERLSPPGAFIARWYCPSGHRTFSLLPDCLAARLPGTLAEVEAVVSAVEKAESLEAACADSRLEVELPGVLRWVRRRVQAVHAALILLKGLVPALFVDCKPRLGAFAERLGVEGVLQALRQIAAPPSGFASCTARIQPPAAAHKWTRSHSPTPSGSGPASASGLASLLTVIPL